MKFFENLSVRKKIFSTFIFVLIIVIAVGLIGFFSSQMLGTEISNMYHHETEPIGSVSHVIQNVMTLSSSFDMAILAAMSGDYDSVKDFETTVNKLYKETELMLSEVKDKIYDSEAQILFDSAYKKYYETLEPTGPVMFRKLYERDVAAAEEVMGAADVSIGKMTDEFRSCLDLKINKAYNTFVVNEEFIRNKNIILILIIAVGTAVTIGLAILLSVSITRPVLVMMRFAKETAQTGNLDISAHEIERVAERRDEIGQTVQAFNEMTAMFKNRSKILKTISHGDLTSDINLKSKSDTMGNSLAVMQEDLSSMMNDVSSASHQVATGINQISTGAEELSESINEQNNSIESITSSLHDIKKNVNTNLTSSESAKDLVDKINREA